MKCPTKRISQLLFTAAAMAATTGVAAADDQPAPEPAAGGDGAAATVDAELGVYGVANWPTSYVTRPQNAGKGMLEVTPSFQFLRVASDDGMGGTASTNVTDLGVAGRFGITDRIEALAAFNRIVLSGIDGIETGDRFKGQLAVGAGVVLARGKLDVEVKAAIIDELGGLGIEELALQAGADVRFHVNDKVWIGTPINRAGLIAGLTNIKLGGAELPDSKPLVFEIPFAVAFQATPQVAIQANTRLVDFNLNDASKAGAGDKTVTFLSQDEFGGLPVDVDLIYGLSNKLDVLLNLNLVDLKHTGDELAVTGGVNLRM